MRKAETHKRVAIITIVSSNFGNRLQNYALQEVLNGLGFYVETVRRSAPIYGIKCFKRKCISLIKAILMTQTSRFESFNKRIKWSNYCADADEIFGTYSDGTLPHNNISCAYDYFISGSDQVWNPHYNFVGSIDLLTFVKSEKKISYAASFGVDDLLDNVKNMYRKALLDFGYLSVREETGKNIIRNLTGQEAKLVLDPTLLLSVDKWRRLEKRNIFLPRKRYVLVYALEENNPRLTEEIEKIKVTESLPGRTGNIEIFDTFEKNVFGKRLPIGPAEFVYLIDHAEVILTNSFHATVFSILFHKPVMTFTRSDLDMSSRIATLASIFKLTDHYEKDGTLVINYKNHYVDYSEIDRILDEMRKVSIAFLTEALGASCR